MHHAYHRGARAAIVVIIALALAACVSNASGPGDVPSDCAQDRDRPGDPAGVQTAADAVVVALTTAEPSTVLSPLALCPAGDVDGFRIDGLGAGEALQVELVVGQADAGGDPDVDEATVTLRAGYVFAARSAGTLEPSHTVHAGLAAAY
ncbi:MAG TPA: hypothetical protein VM734_11520 [Kofleriaceae bacterium]|jgi:hypothetical protein|nr:hypothetical protein [Kofleriaceae bacterium]